MPLASSGELSSFLSSIGASSLSTQLDTTTSQQRGQASIIHDKIQQEIDAVNVRQAFPLCLESGCDESKLSLSCGIGRYLVTVG